MNVTKEARRDAFEFARSEVSTGEGAGNRRRLITATVMSKIETDPAYARAFQRELDAQDMADHVTKSKRERHRKDISEAVTKNTKAIVTGNHQSASSTVVTAVVIGYILHQTGLDRKLLDKAKEIRDVVRDKFGHRRLKLVVVDRENESKD